jgi:Secreted repeat of unknown function
MAPTKSSNGPEEERPEARRDRGTHERRHLQVTYRKHPLYLFAPDRQAGQVTGQGSAASWYVMSAGGAAIVKPLATTTAPGTTGVYGS